MADTNRLPVPPGPADTLYDLGTLAQLSFLKTAAEFVDTARNTVQPGNQENIVAGTRELIEQAQHLHTLAVIAQHEQGDTFDQFDEDPTTMAEYRQAFTDWYERIARPWVVLQRDDAQDPRIETRVPEALADPLATHKELGDWFGRQYGYADDFFEYGLREHSPSSEAISIERHGRYLGGKDDTTDLERAAHQQRAARFARAQRTTGSRLMLRADDLPEGTTEVDTIVEMRWPDIVLRLHALDPELHKLILQTERMCIAQSTVVFGTTSAEDGAKILQHANRATIADAIFETTGVPMTIRIMAPDEYQAYREERDAPPF